MDITAILVFLSVAAFYITSVTGGVLNKQAMSQAVGPAVLSSAHLLVAIILDVVIIGVRRLWRRQGGGAVVGTVSPSADVGDPILTSRRYSWTFVIKTFWPVSLAMVLSKLGTYMSYQTLSMPLTQIAKATEPLFNVVLAFCLFRERQTRLVVFSLVVIGVGVAIASARDHTWNTLGFVFALASAAFKVLQNICLKRIMDGAKYTFFEVHLFSAAASMLLLLPVMGTDVLMATTSLIPRSALAVVVLSSLSQFLSSVSSYAVLSMTHHLTFTVINCLKRVVLIFGGMLYFHIELTPRNVSGAILALSGLFLYKLARSRLHDAVVDKRRVQSRQLTKALESGRFPSSAAPSVASTSLPGTPADEASTPFHASLGALFSPTGANAARDVQLHQTVGDLLDDVLSPTSRQRRTDPVAGAPYDSDNDDDTGGGNDADDDADGGSLLDDEDVALLARHESTHPYMSATDVC